MSADTLPDIDIAALMTVLTAADRCDACPAQAHARAHLKSGDLLFCAHHLRKNEGPLLAAGAIIYNGPEVYSGTPGGSV